MKINLFFILFLIVLMNMTNFTFEVKIKSKNKIKSIGLDQDQSKVAQDYHSVATINGIAFFQGGGGVKGSFN